MSDMFSFVTRFRLIIDNPEDIKVVHMHSRVPRDEILEHELSLADRRAKREIRQLEEEIPRLQAIVDSLNWAGTAPTEFDSQCR